MRVSSALMSRLFNEFARGDMDPDEIAQAFRLPPGLVHDAYDCWEASGGSMDEEPYEDEC